MNLNYNSFYSDISSGGSHPHASKTVKWLPMDTEELYKQNLVTKYDQLKKYNWIDYEFTYKFNSFGFRCDEFTNEPSIMFLGCSHTLGIGLPNEFIWPTIVSNKINLKSLNLGQGGCSSNTCYRLGSYWIPKILPKIVVYLQPQIWRLEILNNNKLEFLLPNGSEDYMRSINLLEFYKVWMSDDTNGYLNCEKNKLALENICYKNKCEFFYFDENKLEWLDLARDLCHAGIESNLKLANDILNII